MSTNTETQTRRPPLDKALNGLEGMEVVVAEPNSPTNSSREGRNTGRHHTPEPPLGNVAPVPREQADSLVAHEISQPSYEPTRPTPGPIRESHTAEHSIWLFNASKRPEGGGVANPRAEVERAASVHQGSAPDHESNGELEKLAEVGANQKVNDVDAESKQPSAPSTH